MFHTLTDTISFIKDTDVLGSDTNAVVANDAGVTLTGSNNFSACPSYRIDYNIEPTAGLKSTGNTLGV